MSKRDDEVYVTLEVAGHRIVIEIVPSRTMPDRYDELTISTERHPHGPAWSTDLLRGDVEE